MKKKLKISGKFLPDILYGYYYQRKKFLINVLTNIHQLPELLFYRLP